MDVNIQETEVGFDHTDRKEKKGKNVKFCFSLLGLSECPVQAAQQAFKCRCRACLPVTDLM